MIGWMTLIDGTRDVEVEVRVLDLDLFSQVERAEHLQLPQGTFRGSSCQLGGIERKRVERG